MKISSLKSYIRNIIKESISPEQSEPIIDKYNSIYSGMLKGDKKRLMKYIDPKFNRPNPDAMAMGRAIKLVKKDSGKEEVNEARWGEVEDAYILHRLADNVGQSVAEEFLADYNVDMELLRKNYNQGVINKYELRDIVNGKAHRFKQQKFMETYVKESVNERLTSMIREVYSEKVNKMGIYSRRS